MFWKKDKSTYSYVIAGLGNPGPKYEKTRHNVGFLALDELASRTGIRVDKLKHKALIGTGTIDGQRVILMKPQTFMNNSGQAVRQVLDYYKIPDERLIVIYDDMDLDQGALRIRKKGSAGSHNGMRSIVSELGNQDFPRVRVGIGGAGESGAVDHVIGKVSKADQSALADAAADAARSVISIIEDGIDIAMNKYNKR